LIKLHDKPAQELELTADSFTIGRKPDNDLPIEDPAVSAHHARITKIHAVYFIEDLQSTNGTFVNDRPIDRHQLRDTDVVTVGRHRIIFRDRSTAAMAPAASIQDLDKTMAIPGHAHKTDAPPQPANLRVLSGKTDQQEYQLVKAVTAIGSHAHAAVKLTGWFAARTAAIISRRHHAYFVSQSSNRKKILVNGQEVSGERELHDKDRIEVAGVTMLFQIKSEKKG
jgi:pSer/pThr/pTyr-binding forkhead associated (FHA) protein